ncbi:MAG: tRNA (guanosine(46)-N7)-methyltransferase TrmB [Spirochaetes bacterium]|nr:tRNA (guanosine(46)-N7)-methyltransferase TrmB [Spirochaetota bacterium]
MIKSYVLRLGHYTAAQKKAYEKLSGEYLIPFLEENLDYERVFGNKNGVTLEIGFGSGLATAAIASENPDKNYLGIEVHRPGIGRLLWEIENRRVHNIKIIEYDAVQVLEKMIPSLSLDAVHVFFPDPWPKKKHRRRRLIQRPFTEKLTSSLKHGGYLYMVTDNEDYALHALEELNACSILKNNYEGFAAPQSWRPKTKFEQKGLEKHHTIRELLFSRKI